MSDADKARFDAQVEELSKRMFRHRFNPNSHERGWSMSRLHSKDMIRTFLEEGNIVRTGYYATSVRGYHEFVILYRKRKTKAKRVNHE